MIRVTTSHRLTELVGALEEALPPPGQLFEGPWLIVPSRPLELYVDLELARRRGVSGNLDTLSLRAAFARLCAAATPDVVLVDRPLLCAELLGVLGRPPESGDGSARGRRADGDAGPPVAAEVLRPVDDYLRAAGSEAGAVDRRRVELARAFAALFDGWEQSRPERMAAWRGGWDRDAAAGARRSPAGDTATTREAADDPALLAAERRLWTLLHGPDGRFARRGQLEGRRYLTLSELVEQGLDDAWAPPPALHLFGFADLPRGWLGALQHLARKTSIAIYAYNPCREFWEDVDTRRAPARARRGSRGRAASHGPASDRQLALDLGGGTATVAAPPPPVSGEIDRAGDNPCLERWGQLGREASQLWVQLADGDPDARHGDASAPPSTLLAALQRDIVALEPARIGARRLDLPPDGSLTLVRAPDARREIETVAAQIWTLVRQASAREQEHGQEHERAAGALRFSDIAVLIAGPDAPYQSLIPSVFHEASRLPHTLLDAPLGASSRVAEALLALLALPLGAFTRREVLALVTHPNIRARFPESDPAVWLALCEELGIVRGADLSTIAGSYLESDAFTWEEGLRRLALGRFATGPRSGSEDPVALPASPRASAVSFSDVPAELAPDFRPDADALALLVRSLLADARFARRASLPVAEWVRYVHALADAYVLPASPEDEAARLHVFAALDRLAAASSPDVMVSLAVAHELIRDALGDLRGTRGQVFGNGVVVGSLDSLRTLPFRAIFVVGLGPERFPSSARTRPLDPGGPVPPGNPTPAERDRYAFLQALLGAEERLILTTVDRDPSTGDARDPSPVVLELQDIVASGYTRSPAWIREVPRDRDGDPQVRAAFPAARAEAEARVLGAALVSALPEADRLAEAEVCAALSPATRDRLAPLLGPPSRGRPRSEGAAQRNPRPRVVRIGELRRFLECPLQGAARLRLGLRHLIDDTEARETSDEPFDVPRGLERAFLADVFTTAWDGPAPPAGGALAAAYDRAVRRPSLARALPAGLFGAAARERHLTLLEWWSLGLQSAGCDLAGPPVDIHVGRPDSSFGGGAAARTPRTDQRAALAFRVLTDVDRERELPIELRGRPAPELAQGQGQGQGDAGQTVGSLLLSPSPYPKIDLEALRLFLDHVLLAATAPTDEPPRARRGLLISMPKPKNRTAKASVTRIDFAPLARDRARAYLGDLVTDLFGRTHDYLLPCEAVFMYARGDKDLVECITEVRDDPYYRRSSTTGRGPVPEPFDSPIPPAADAQAFVERRFGLFSELRLSSRGAKEEEDE